MYQPLTSQDPKILCLLKSGCNPTIDGGVCRGDLNPQANAFCKNKEPGYYSSDLGTNGCVYCYKSGASNYSVPKESCEAQEDSQNNQNNQEDSQEDQEYCSIFKNISCAFSNKTCQPTTGGGVCIDTQEDNDSELVCNKQFGKFCSQDTQYACFLGNVYGQKSCEFGCNSEGTACGEPGVCWVIENNQDNKFCTQKLYSNPFCDGVLWSTKEECENSFALNNNLCENRMDGYYLSNASQTGCIQCVQQLGYEVSLEICDINDAPNIESAECDPDKNYAENNGEQGDVCCIGGTSECKSGYCVANEGNNQEKGQFGTCSAAFEGGGGNYSNLFAEGIKSENVVHGYGNSKWYGDYENFDNSSFHDGYDYIPNGQMKLYGCRSLPRFTRSIFVPYSFQLT